MHIPPDTIHKILIIRMSSIGDVVLTAPVVRQLRERYPAAQIDFLIRREYAELVRYNPHISRVIELDTREGRQGLHRMKGYIRESRYDVILDLHRNLRSRYVCQGAGFPRVLKLRKNQLIRFLLVHFKINRYPNPPLSVAEKYLRAALPLGIDPSDTRLEIFLPVEIQQEGQERWQAFRRRGMGVVVAPGARHFTKRWLPEYYRKLIERIHHNYGWGAVLVGGPEEAALCREICHGLPEDVCTSVAGELSLLQTAAILREAPLFISNDSGLMHIVAAYQKPQIAIFGSTVRELGFFPLNPRAIVLENSTLACRPCSHIGRAACPKGHFNCMKEITPGKVMAAVESIVRKF